MRHRFRYLYIFQKSLIMLGLILGLGIVYGVLNQLEIQIGLIAKAIIAAPFGYGLFLVYKSPGGKSASRFVIIFTVFCLAIVIF